MQRLVMQNASKLETKTSELFGKDKEEYSTVSCTKHSVTLGHRAAESTVQLKCYRDPEHDLDFLLRSLVKAAHNKCPVEATVLWALNAAAAWHQARQQHWSQVHTQYSH